MKLKYIFPFVALSVVVCMTSCNDDNEGVETKPAVSSAAVINNGIDVPRNKDITVTFNEEMNSKTVNSNTLILSRGETRVEGIVSYSQRTARFKPSHELEPKEKYVLRLTTGIQDKQGNALAEDKVLMFTTAGTKEMISPVLLREAGDFVILAKSTIINNPHSALTGDVGIFPAEKSYIAGFYLIDRESYSSSAQVSGKIYSPNMTTNTTIYLMNAVNSMSLAYEDAEERKSPDFLNLDEGTIGSNVLSQGVYKWTTSLTLTSNITLSGGEDDVWIFQIDGDLLVKQDVTIILINGAQAKNVFWQVKGEAVAESNAHVEGNILSREGILLGDGVTLNGRALSQTGIILSGNKILKPQSF